MIRLAPFRRVLFRAVAAACCLPFAAGAAQERPAEWTVSGRVVLAAAGEDLRPVPGVWVALNRVGEDSAGVIDSVRTARDGSYRFAYQRTGDPDAMYFTDVLYGGVAYFTEPLKGVHVSGEDAELVVFDTSSTSGTLRLRGRHAVVGPSLSNGDRAVVEVFELTNDTSLTLVPRSDTQPVWSVALPAGALAPEVGGGDIPPTVVRFQGGRAELYAPLAPGLRQLSVRYTLPPDAFPLVITMAQPAEFLEVLLAKGAEVSGAGLHEERTVEIEGDPYRRYLSQRSAAGDQIRITLQPRVVAVIVPVVIAGAVLALAGGLAYARRTV